MKKRLLLALTVLGLPACDLIGPKCGRGANVLPYFDVEGVFLIAQEQGRVLTTDEPISFDALQLQLRLQQRFYAAGGGLGFTAAAYACDPAPNGYRGTSETLDSVVVTSRYDYDARHPAGKPLNDLLRFHHGYSAGTLAQLDVKTLDLNDWTWVLTQGPASASTQQFVVRYYLRGGETYAAETPRLTLRP